MGCATLNSPMFRVSFLLAERGRWGTMSRSLSVIFGHFRQGRHFSFILKTVDASLFVMKLPIFFGWETWGEGECFTISTSFSCLESKWKLVLYSPRLPRCNPRQQWLQVIQDTPTCAVLMLPLQVSGNLPDTGNKVKSQARPLMSRMMSLHAHVR